MRVMVIVKATKGSEAGGLPSAQLLAEMGKYNEELAQAGILLAGEGLHPSAKGTRILFSGKERSVSHGPFPETEQLVAGFWIWKVHDLDEAIAWVKRCPNPHAEDSVIEIRPVFEAEDFGEVFTPELREQEASLRAQTLGLGLPKFLDCPAREIAGLNETYTFDRRGEIPAQWMRFAPHIGKVPGQVGTAAYGLCWNYQPGRSFDYLTGVEVDAADGLPARFTRLPLAPQRYAVFTHSGPVAQISATIDAIWKKWVPESGLKIASAPSFEAYTERFDPSTGSGEVDIYIPIQS